MGSRGLRLAAAGPAAAAPERVPARWDDARARIVAAPDEARPRLERDLHDGAQQRFVLASLCLERAAAEARGTAAEPLLAEASEHLRLGLADLRDLAHGIHPAAVSRRGLADRLEARGGTLSIDSPRGRPTSICAEAPLRPAP
jgi:signal transduction histidine kinase